jgi:hypothetical protein
VFRVTTFTVVGVIRSLLAELLDGVGAGAVGLSQLVTAKRVATASNRIVTARMGSSRGGVDVGPLLSIGRARVVTRCQITI